MQDPHLERLRAQWPTLPEPPLRAQWQAVCRQIRLHTRGNDPRDTLLRRHRYEDDTSLNWRLDNYQPITQPVIQRGITALTRLLRDTEYDLQISPQLEAYTRQPRFEGRDFFLYLQEHVLPQMIEDPNGLLVWLPHGPGLHDAEQPVDVRPLCVPSHHIRYQDDNSLVIRQHHPNSPTAVTDGTASALSLTADAAQAYNWVFTPHNIYTTEPHPTTPGQVVFRHMYTHHMGRLPALTLGGNWQTVGTSGYYDSFFSGFVAFGNEALRQFSDWQAVVSLNAYPIKELQPIVCDAPGCHHGQVTLGGETRPCTQCHGTGYVYHTGPFNALIRPEVNPALGETDNGQPLLRYITPPTEIIQYAQQAWELLLTKAEDALQLGRVLQPQSGVAKAQDREELYGMLSRIGTHVFDHLMAQSLDILERYRNIVNPQPVRVVKPRQFTLQGGANHLAAELSAAQEAGLPQALLAELVRRWAGRQLDGDPLAQRRLHVLLLADPLYLLSAAEKREWVRHGVVSPDQVQHSQQLDTALSRLITQKGAQWFLHAPDDAILAHLLPPTGSTNG